ncbi:MAG: hypothetical protein MI673_01865 [Thiotrichales bacterium]|nr:hypothetical protein [Thiotrichales bacterium]
MTMHRGVNWRYPVFILLLAAFGNASGGITVRGADGGEIQLEPVKTAVPPGFVRDLLDLVNELSGLS